jgi:hypothetical protein
MESIRVSGQSLRTVEKACHGSGGGTAETAENYEECALYLALARPQFSAVPIGKDFEAIQRLKLSRLSLVPATRGALSRQFGHGRGGEVFWRRLSSCLARQIRLGPQVRFALVIFDDEEFRAASTKSFYVTGAR